MLTNPKNAALAADLHFEKAYTQYRLNTPKEALQTVDNAPELTPALKELRYLDNLLSKIFTIFKVYCALFALVVIQSEPFVNLAFLFHLNYA